MIRRLLRVSVLAGVLVSAFCSLQVSTLLMPASYGDDADPASDEATETPPDTTPVGTFPVLPLYAPNGQPYRTVRVFLSQLAELVPENYMPVAIDKLSEAAEKALEGKSSEELPQIRGSHYVVHLLGDTLVSDRSTIDIQYDGTNVTEQTLGKVNFAIDPLPTRSVVTNDSLPRLESHSDGSLSAFVDGDANIPFVWSLKGTLRGLLREFDLRIPRSPQTRIELSTPRGVVLDVLDGVVRPLPAPPAGIISPEPESDVQWWRIDAGGLDLVRLRVRTVDDTLDSDAIIVRRSSFQYDIDPSGVNWTCRMIVQFPSGESYPPLVVYGGTILSVSADTVNLPFSTLVRTTDSQIIQMQSARSTAPRQGTTTSLNIAGFCSWDSLTGWCNLPVPSWLATRVLQTASTNQVLIRTTDSLRVVTWELPEQWSYSQPTSADSATLLQAEGPPVAMQSLPVFEDSSTAREESFEELASSIEPAWSRIRLAPHEPLRTFDSMFAYTISDGALDVKARFVIKSHPNRLEPIEFKLEDNWKLLSLSLPVSRRLLESWDVDPSTNTVTVWVDSNEVVNGEIVVEATGRSRLQTGKPSVSIPSSWFMRLLGVRGTMVVAMIPPDSLKWSGDTTMRISRIAPESLTTIESAFFGSPSSETLLFRAPMMSTPAFEMMPPSVSFNITSLLEIHRETDEWVETLELATDAANPILTSLNIETGAALGRPPYRWLLRSEAESEPVSLSSASIRHDESDETGTYRIDVSRRDLGGKTLIGRRRYKSPHQLKVQLPQVYEASSQNAEVLIGKGLEVRSRSDAVIRVPIAPTLTEGPPATATDSPGLSDMPNSDVLHATIDQNVNVRLRYDPVAKPSIVVGSSQFDPNVNLVWHKRVQVAASSRGTDSIELRLRVSATDAVQVKYSPELHVVGVFRDDVRVSDFQRTPTSLTLQPHQGTESIRILWTRNQAFRGWWRRCRIPKIDVNGVVVNERSTLIASSDSFVPATLLFGHLDTETGVTQCDAAPESRKLIMHHNIVLGLGWLVAMLTFSSCFWIANRSASVVAAIVTIAVTVAILWSPWAIAVVGWFILPASAAVLLSASLHYRLIERQDGELSEFDNRDKATSHLGRSHSEEGFSFIVPGSGAAWWILAILMSWSLSRAVAQSPSGDELPKGKASAPTTSDVQNDSESFVVPAIESATTAPFTMIVPVNSTGEMVGDKVYIPGALRETLFQTKNDNEAEVVRFQYADYRVKIEPTRDIDTVTPPSVYADYVVRVDRPSSQVVLPLNGNAVRRVELVGPDDDRIVRFAANNESSIVVNVPPALLYRLRVTLIPAINITAQAARFELAIPPINSARLTVDLDRSVESVTIEGAEGRIVADSDLRRTVAHLGPTSRIVMRYVNRDRAEPAAAQSIDRRYWVQFGKDQTSVDCEVTPTTLIPSGQSVSLVVFDSAMPTLVSPTWRIVVNDMLSPMRRQLTLTSLSDQPTPIRLLWTLPSIVNDFNIGDEPAEMQIPEVSLLTSGPITPTWVAIQNDPALNVAVLKSMPFELLPEDQFLSVWTGYRDRIDQSISASDRVPAFVLTRVDSPRSTVVSRHDLQVGANDITLRYNASLNFSNSRSAPRILKVPPEFELVSVTVNGERIDSAVVLNGADQEVLLTRLPASGPVEIDVLARRSFPQDGRFTPSRFELIPRPDSQDTYMMLRDAATTIRTITPPILQASDDASQNAIEDVSVADTLGPVVNRISDAAMLAAGWIPVMRWQIINSPNAPSLLGKPKSPELESSETIGGDITREPVATNTSLPGGLFEATSQPNRFSTNQLILLAWQDGRWSMETHVEITNGTAPDFIDVEVPTRWCESLEVSPERTWSRQPSTNPLLQIIRIRCDSSLRKERVTIRGQLKTSDKGRISVPNVSVLGNGRRNVFVSVPDRLTNDNISWRSNAVSKTDFPKSWETLLNATTTERSTYVVAGPGWSIELVALPVATANAEVTSAETQVYVSNSFALILAHWDLVPGGVTSVGVELPVDAELVGAWAATQPMRATVVRPKGDASNDKQNGETSLPSSARSTVRVPLALDRLSQSIEVLYRVRAPRASSADYMALLKNISQNESITHRETWVSIYSLAEAKQTHTTTEANSAELEEPSTSLDLRSYALAQATSVVEAVESSEDNLAERPADEIVSWLVPWINRYAALGQIAGRQVDFETLIASASVNTERELAKSKASNWFANASNDVAMRIAEARWGDLDRRIGVFVDRFLSEQSVSDEARRQLASRFAVEGFDGYERTDIRLVTHEQLPPAILWPVESGTDSLRQLIANCLTVLLVLALLVLSWRFKHFILHIVHHPAIWLAVLAVCSFFVAPIPFAASLMLLAIVLPLVPRTKDAAKS